MSQPADFDLNFRPDYHSPADALAAILVNIKGQRRREIIAEFVAARVAEAGEGVDPAEAAEAALAALSPELLAQELPDPNMFGCRDMTFMGGEYLPSYMSGEVEIARITLDSSARDVVSIRARQRARCIMYRVVDEYGEEDSQWHWSPQTSRRPLTMGQIIRLMDTMYDINKGSPEPDYFTWVWDWDWNDSDNSDTPEYIVEFISVSSDFYPQLDDYYIRRGEEWAAEKRSLEPVAKAG